MQKAVSTSHASYVFGGPLYWAVMVLIVIVTVGAAALVIDALRRPRDSFKGLGFGTRWIWIVPVAVYLVSIVVLFWTAFLPIPAIMDRVAAGQWTATVTGLLMFVSVPLEIAYLLRVVFPVPGAAPEPLEHLDAAADDSEQGNP